MIEFLDFFQRSLGYTFKDASLITQALTHRSYSVQHNERLEFLGDAILDFLVGEFLYHRYPAANEGELSQMRAQAVCGEQLAAAGRNLQLGECLRLGAGEIKSGGQQRDSNIANAVEALIAAIYLDGGMDSCREVVYGLFGEVLEQLHPGVLKDSKTRLQEYLQSRHMQLPQYKLLVRAGVDHSAIFTMECDVAELNLRAVATASSRKKAEQLAAEDILGFLELKSEK